jgi:orotate phosphoribosyltransferase
LDARSRLLEIAKRDAFRRGQFVLSSGRTSTFYVDVRMVTLSAEGAYLVGKTVYEAIGDSGAEAVGGPTIGADPIATAVAIESYNQGAPIPAFLVRKEAKGHGTKKSIEGPLPKKEGVKVAIVEDTITTGGSIVHAIEEVEAAGCKVVKVVVIVDRLEGGADDLRARGYDVASVFTVEDFGVTREELAGGSK